MKQIMMIPLINRYKFDYIENKINEFAKDHNIIDIKCCTTYVMVIYETEERKVLNEGLENKSKYIQEEIVINRAKSTC